MGYIETIISRNFFKGKKYDELDSYDKVEFNRIMQYMLEKGKKD